MNGPLFYSCLQVFQSLYLSSRDCLKHAYYYWYYCHLNLPYLLLLLLLTLMFSHRSSSDSKSSQVSRTLLGIHNLVVWMVSTHPDIFNSSSPFINPSMTVPRAPITIGMNVTFMFSFFPSLARSRYLSFFSISHKLLYGQPGLQSPQFASSLFFSFFFFFFIFLLIIIRFGLLTEIKRSICMLKSHKSLCVSFSWGGVLVV